MNSKYFYNLLKKVLEKSEAKNWEKAVLEWDIYDCEEDEDLQTSCICGKENIRYLFTIINHKNNNLLFPIGSKCIKKFERNDLNEIISIKEGMFKLLHAVKENEFLSLSSEFFTRKILNQLFNEGVFKSSQYNKYDPANDYQFMLDMFNKRNKLTDKQDKKVKALIINSIKPYLIEKLNNKINKKR